MTLNKTLENAEFDSVLLGWVTFFISPILLFYQQVLVVRRLHDFNYSGWFVLFNLVPVLIGSILVSANSILAVALGLLIILIKIILLIIKGTPGTNRFGLNPRRTKFGISKYRDYESSTSEGSLELHKD